MYVYANVNPSMRNTDDCLIRTISKRTISPTVTVASGQRKDRMDVCRMTDTTDGTNLHYLIKVGIVAKPTEKPTAG